LQAYSDPERENDPHALPDVEVFYIPMPRRAYDQCEHRESAGCEDCPEPGWYWWSCFPGCLPFGEPIGPFSTEAEALADARDCD
jgi:hypothetical protein